MQEIDIASITKKSVRGVFAFTSRSLFIQIITFVSNFLLTIFLSPAIFGVFFLVSAAIAFLSYFSDIGLAAALIQKKDKLTDEDLRTTFTFQQLLVIPLVILAFIFSGFMGEFYNLDKNGILLFQVLAFSFFLSSLKTIPSIILERNLDFEKLVIPQIIEAIVFNVIVVVLAVQGYGVASFTYAVLFRGIAGLIAIYVISPWKVQIGFSRQTFKSLVSFGIPFQTNSLLALVKDDLLIVYLGKILPLSQVGYIGFAQKWAFLPLRTVMDNVIRITFPSFSRLQHDTNILGKAVEKSIFASCFIIFPSLVGLVVLAPYFIDYVPRYSKWEPALFSLALFSFSAGLSSVSTPLTNAMNAIGRIKITLYLMVFWTVLTWVLTPIMVMIYGYSGVAISSAIISVSVIGVVFIVKRYININIFNVVKYPLLSAIVMGVAIFALSSVVVTNLPTLLLMILIGAVIYFSTLIIFAKNQVKEDIRLVRKYLQK